MGLNFMMDALKTIKGIDFQVLYTSNCEIEYNVIIVAKIYKDGFNQAI